MGDWDRAIADYGRAIELEPQGRRQLVPARIRPRNERRLRRRAGRPGPGDHAAPKDLSYRFTRGFAYRKKGDWDKASGRSGEVLRQNPKFVEVYRERGYVTAQKGDLDKGLADLDEAVKRNPQDYEARLCRGDVYVLKGDLQRAIADYDEALRLDPAFAEARFHRAMARVEKNDLQEALADYKELIRLDPRSAEGYADMGPGRGQPAAGQGRRPARTSPASRQGRGPDPRPTRRRAAQGQGTGQGHRRVRQGPGIVSPRFAEIYYNCGLAYRQKEDLNTAIANYTQAIRLNPSTSPPMPIAAIAYYKQGSSTGRLPISTQSSNSTQQRRRPQEPRVIAKMLAEK